MASDPHQHEPDKPVVVPILPVRSLTKAETLHRAIGLHVDRYDDSYAWVKLAGHEIWHLRVVEDLDPDNNPTSIFVFVQDLDTIHDRLADAGLNPTPITGTPWGMRETSVRDPNGNLIRIGWFMASDSV